jgi:hypothetical protein
MSIFTAVGALIAAPPSTTETTSSKLSETDVEVDVDIGVDDALSLLGNERRRQTIRFASEEAAGEFDIADIVQYIATHECGQAYTAADRKRVYVSLYQNHLPALVDAGVFEQAGDGDGHTYRVGAPAQPLYEILEATTSRLGGDA